MQRMRVEFSRGEEAKFASHLDLMRAWPRALRRAGLPLGYSEGFTPRPRISLAAPLPVGVTGSAELMDVFLKRRVSSLTFLKGLNAQCPPGLAVHTAEEVPLSLPSLQSLVRAADYVIQGPAGTEANAIRRAIAGLLQAREVPWEHARDTGVRRYDLRPLVQELELEEWSKDSFTISMRLRMDAHGTGRPDQVTAALGVGEAYTSIHRRRIILAQP